MDLCTFCPGGQEVDEALLSLLSLERALPSVLQNHTAWGHLSSCQDAVHAVLNNNESTATLVSTPQDCRVLQTIGTYCGCPVRQDACYLCGQEEESQQQLPVGSSAKPVRFLTNETFGFTPTCEFQQAYLLSLSQTNQNDGAKTCRLLQQARSYCDCPQSSSSVDGVCEVCQTELDNPQMDVGHLPTWLNEEGITSTKGTTGIVETCEFVLESSYGVGRIDWPSCLDLSAKGTHCGCNLGDYTFYGNNTVPKARTLVAVTHLSAILSLLGSAAILTDILRNKSKRKRVYHRIMLGMVFFDVCTGLGFIWGTLPVPRYHPVSGVPTLILGARGTDATCKLQGFLIQLGIGTIFYNISLSVYYKLVIVHTWRNDRLRQIQGRFHIVPIALALVLAFGSIPFYRPSITYCHFFVEPSVEPVETAVALFAFIIPVTAALVILISLTIRVYLAVRANTRTSQRWTFSTAFSSRNNSTRNLNSMLFRQDESRVAGLPPNASAPSSPAPNRAAAMVQASSSGSSRLENEVFWQCLWYILAFVVIWPVCFVIDAIALSGGLSDNFALGLLAQFVIPLQGLTNALVYFRPRIRTWWKKSRSAQRATQEGGSESTGHSLFGRILRSTSNPRRRRQPLGNMESEEALHTFTRFEEPSADIADEPTIVDKSCELTNRELPVEDSESQHESIPASGLSSCPSTPESDQQPDIC